MSKAELLLQSILRAVPLYKPCLQCKHSYFKPTSHVGWCKNVPSGCHPRPIDEVDTCEAWKSKADG